MRNLYKSVFTSVFFAFSVFRIEAQLLQSYNFVGSAGTELTLGPDGQPQNGTFGNIRRGSGLATNAGLGTFSAAGFTLATAKDTADYFQFAVKANSNYKINLDSLVLAERRSNSGIRTWEIWSSRDNFQTAGTLQKTFAVEDDNLTRKNQRIPFGTSLLNVPASETVTFRFYGYGAEADAGTWRLDSIRVYGQITTGTPVMPTAKFSTSMQTVSETADSIRVTVQINPSPTSSYNVNVVIKGGTAVSGTDYTPAPSGTLSFEANSSSATFKIKLIDDLVQDGNKTLLLVLQPEIPGIIPSALIGTDSTQTVTITDNESPVVVEPLPGTRTVAQIKGANTGNQADSVGKSFRIYGTVYGINQRITLNNPTPPPAGYQMFLRDATGGIGIFKTTFVNGITTLNEGDSVKVMGKIEVFRGLSQIIPDSMVILATGRAIKTPTVVLKLNENLEGDLVRINGVQLLNPAAWVAAGAGFTVRVFKDLDTTDVRIDNDCSLFNAPVPTGTFDIIGMGGQFVPGTPTPVAPFPARGYQLIPRRTADLIPVVSVNPLYNLEIEVKVYPNPGSEELVLENKAKGKLSFQIFNALGKSIITIIKPEEFQKVDTKFWSTGIYFIKIVETGKTISWIKK